MRLGRDGAPIGPFEVEEIVCRVREVGVRASVSRAFLATVRADVARDAIIDGLAVALTGYVLEGARHVEETRDIPATWWDAVKARWFPRWALRRWPARTERIETVVIHVCPHQDPRPYAQNCVAFLRGPA